MLERFELAEELWSDAMRADRLAPPDQGFGDRLRALSEAASVQAAVLRDAARLGLAGRPIAQAEDAMPPYELRPDAGRRGPERLWQRFDRAVERFNPAAAQADRDAVALAHAELSAAGGALADALDTEHQL